MENAMVDYAEFRLLEVAHPGVKIDDNGDRVTIHFLNEGTPLQLQMNRQTLERLCLLAKRELERHPKPGRAAKL
jgi:hypothetical protein